ncbi:FHA domain-containing protein [Ureibacillus sp. Re31]|uniref:FHA domain-containing protein n=1 Tax=Ureibacillus galli TaxID=2762222 RepID=A0ABR8XCJ4_9BACL|nr:FHA domain-containing protein [Ureibacillus galli]MBD8026899.1 FHA domain-containing protein [Ureibacillus galli]
MAITNLKQTPNGYLVTAKLVESEDINQRQLEMINHHQKFIAGRYEITKKYSQLIFEVNQMLPLKIYLKRIIWKHQFFKIVEELIDIVRCSEEIHSNSENILLDFDYIFINPTTMEMQAILLPLVNNHNPLSVKGFFQEFLHQCLLASTENHDYTTRYFEFFKNNQPFSLQRFERMFFEISGKSMELVKEEKVVQKPASKEPVSIAYNPIHRNKELNKDREVFASNQVVSNFVEMPSKTIFCMECGTKLVSSAKFCINCGHPVKVMPPVDHSLESSLNEENSTETFSETTVLGNSDELEGTTVLGSGELEQDLVAYLQRKSTQEKVMINRDEFKIGKDPSQCDFVISDNKAISRYHAKIIRRNNRFYIVDCRSTNKTFVEGLAILPESEMEIFAGTNLKFGNEEFLFSI